MATFSWPCPRCGTTQKARAEGAVNTLCAACTEQAQEAARTEAASARTEGKEEKKERAR